MKSITTRIFPALFELRLISFLCTDAGILSAVSAEVDVFINITTPLFSANSYTAFVVGAFILLLLIEVSKACMFVCTTVQSLFALPEPLLATTAVIKSPTSQF